jgi:hypothetical protein
MESSIPTDISDAKEPRRNPLSNRGVLRTLPRELVNAPPIYQWSRPNNVALSLVDFFGESARIRLWMPTVRNLR